MVATVLSARPWEARLVAMARAAGSIRVVGRLYQPEDLERLRRVDVLVVGAETTWATPARVRSWCEPGDRRAWRGSRWRQAGGGPLHRFGRHGDAGAHSSAVAAGVDSVGGNPQARRRQSRQGYRSRGGARRPGGNRDGAGTRHGSGRNDRGRSSSTSTWPPPALACGWGFPQETGWRWSPSGFAARPAGWRTEPTASAI